MVIRHEDSLRASVRRYDLEVVDVSPDWDEKDKVCITLARRNSGTLGGHYRNLRAAVLSPELANQLLAQRVLRFRQGADRQSWPRHSIREG